MVTVTAVVAIVFILLGIIGYLGTGRESITALIPAFFGIVFAGLAWLGRQERFLKHSMHAAAVLALLALIGSVNGVPDAISWLSGAETARPAAAVSKSLMALVSVIFIALAVASFIRARRQAS